MLLHGDCLNKLKELDDNSVDSLVTDPPAGIAFMGKEWDEDKGGSKQWIAWLRDVMKEALRVMKPGAHGFVWAIPRTSHWTATALEDAGFEIRDKIFHHFGSGFPKSFNINKALEKDGKICVCDGKENSKQSSDLCGSCGKTKVQSGLGTALKPSTEEWILVRKPCSERTVAANVLKHGTGGLNIDASRVGLETIKTQGGDKSPNNYGEFKTCPESFHQGRFPANLVLSHNPDCVEVGVKKVKGDKRPIGHGAQGDNQSKGWGTKNVGRVSKLTDTDGTETVPSFECTPGCAVAELDRQSGDRPVSGSAKLGKPHSGGHKAGFSTGPQTERISPNDSGGASRFFKTFESSGSVPRSLKHECIPGNWADDQNASFFYCAKASKSERNEGCEGLPEKEKKTLNSYGDQTAFSCPDGANRVGNKGSSNQQNIHPTVKPIRLMSYLITMVTPPNGVVLDPFMGSGSTGVAALKSGFRFLGIEKELEYFQIAESRIINTLAILMDKEEEEKCSKKVS